MSENEIGGVLGKIQGKLAPDQRQTLGRELPKNTWYYRFGNFIEKLRRSFELSVPQSEEGYKSRTSVGKFHDE